jgi:ABC-type microcin C transport system duplicated ATPase subunit YejF
MVDLTRMSRRQLKPIRKTCRSFSGPVFVAQPRMSVFDIISEPLIIRHARRRAAPRSYSRALEMVNARAARARYPYAFSGGQRRRIRSRAPGIATEADRVRQPVSALDVVRRKS